ncbi:MAG TPA: DUF29 domain-containing protein, partial [Aquificaceae bacterium]|nr:DUF29 domain-containing protein [Aquificaceae bacterium]
MRTIGKEELKELYHKDFPLWVEKNLELLREKAYDLVDWENLLEEIEDMGLRHLESCISHLAVILEHLYKWDHFRGLTKAGEEKGGLSWIRSVENARKRIGILFKRYPSLRTKLKPELDYAWEEAVIRLQEWLDKIGEDPDQYHIPEKCPYTYEEAMTR